MLLLITFTLLDDRGVMNVSPGTPKVKCPLKWTCGLGQLSAYRLAGTAVTVELRSFPTGPLTVVP